MSETNEQTVSTEAAPEASERDALIAAVDGLEPEAPANDDGAPPPEPKAAKKDEPAVDEAMNKVGAVLRAREQAQKEREEAQALKTKIIEEAQATKAQILAEAKAEAAKFIEEQRATFQAKFREKPLQAINEFGIDRARLVDEVTREGSPEWQAQKRQEAALEEARKETAELKAWREKQEAEAKANEERRIQYGRAQTEKAFVALVPEGSALRALYDESEIVAKGHALADAYNKKTGEVATLEELRDYMEEQAAKKLATIRGEQPGTSVSAGKPKANGPRVSSAASASERRTSPKPIRDMSPDEEYEALKAAAADAMRTSA